MRKKRVVRKQQEGNAKALERMGECLRNKQKGCKSGSQGAWESGWGPMA
jgi:hypothetical protein